MNRDYRTEYKVEAENDYRALIEQANRKVLDEEVECEKDPSLFELYEKLGGDELTIEKLLKMYRLVDEMTNSAIAKIEDESFELNKDLLIDRFGRNIEAFGDDDTFEDM